MKDSKYKEQTLNVVKETTAYWVSYVWMIADFSSEISERNLHYTEKNILPSLILYVV